MNSLPLSITTHRTKLFLYVLLGYQISEGVRYLLKTNIYSYPWSFGNSVTARRKYNQSHCLYGIDWQFFWLVECSACTSLIISTKNVTEIELIKSKY